MKHILVLPFLALAACAVPPVAPPVASDPQPTLNPAPPPPPPPTALTVDQFDTTSQADRAQAVAVTGAGRSLGVTIASLGPPAEPGIWLKTPLVTALTAGRVTYQGKSINIELRPSGGAAGSGSQISLAAMRLIEAPLTSLPELAVFAQ